MLIIPAIDIMKGKVVRLYRGDFSRDTVYSDDPVKIALEWEEKGAPFLHIVDLDGAREGLIKNGDIIKEVVRSISIPCEVGGGLRTDKDIEYYIKGGAQRTIIGTTAFEDRNYLKRLLDIFRERIVVSIDFSDGKVLKKGWLFKTGFAPLEVARAFEDIGAKRLIFTDVSRDGTLLGPDIDTIRNIVDGVKSSVIISGGIGSIKDIQALKAIKRKNLEGVIIGKALYDGTIDLVSAIAIAND